MRLSHLSNTRVTPKHGPWSAALRVAVVILWSSQTFCGVRASEAQLGVPVPPASGQDSAATTAASLGRRLFVDKRLSADSTISCASCHIPENAFTDGRAVAKGIRGQAGTRNTPSLLNVAFAKSEFWDGRRSSLEQQAIDPLLNPREHGLPDGATLLAVIRSDKEYRAEFQRVYRASPTTISLSLVARALAAFERTLIAGGSPFDHYLYGHDHNALTPAAVRGLQLFRGRAQCATCHLIGDEFALFTDDQYHTLGVGLTDLQPRLVRASTRVVNASPETLDRLIGAEPDIAALGRFVVTLRPPDIGKFKTPSLRNVALTAPYMHDGSVATLAQAIEVEVYYRSLEANVPLILTASEKGDLLAFLQSLTSPAVGHSRTAR